MYSDFLRALTDENEDLFWVEHRLIWKNDENHDAIDKEIRRQGALCAALKAQLQEPEDSADYQYAKRFLDEALAAEADKDAPRQENEKRRAELEAEYNALLTERLNYEKYLAETRNRPRKERTK